MENNNNKDERKRSLLFFIIAIAVFIALLAAFIVYIIFGGRGKAPEAPEGRDTIGTYEYTGSSENGGAESETDKPEPELPENPVNFSKQMEVNKEIYAWIDVPNTNVSYPILQSGIDDLYYLRRDVNGNYDISGVLFTQSHNKKDFKDPVTVVYGHNMTEYGTMFATLHNFENEEFFRDNDKFYIYTPGHILTYEIVSAFKYDNRHIMNTFNFDKEETVLEFFDIVTHPTMIPMNVREGVELKADDRLVVLSTCMSDNTYRYLVAGKLINDERTK